SRWCFARALTHFGHGIQRLSVLPATVADSDRHWDTRMRRGKQHWRAIPDATRMKSEDMARKKAAPKANPKEPGASAEASSTPPPSADPVSLRCPVAGIGASAGGVEAFSELLQALPADSGMAFVLIGHLDPKHTSLLSELLSKSTSMPVREIKHR